MTTQPTSTKGTTMSSNFTAQFQNLTEGALQRVIGFRDRGKEQARIKQLQRDLAPLAAQIDQQATESRTNFESALAGTATAEEVLNAHAAALDAERRRADYVDLHSRIQNELRSFIHRDLRDTYEDDAVAPALEWLNEQLQSLMAAVRDLDQQLSGVGSAEAAIRAGGDKVVAWATLGEAVTVYNQLRETQAHILQKMVHDDGRKNPHGIFRRDSFMRDAFSYEPYYLAQRRWPANRGAFHPAAVPFLEWRNEPIHPAYQRGHGSVWPADDHHNYLRWLASTNQAWIPTIEQLEHAAGLAERMLERNLETALKAFDDYYSGRGIQPVGTEPNTDAIRSALL